VDIFQIEIGVPSVEEFLSLRDSVDMGARSLEGVRKGLGNELCGILLYVKDSEELVGMGRVVGDGGTVFHICDMVVKPEWQKKGGGTMIMNGLMDFIEGLDISNAYVNLIADVDGFYEKWGFKPTHPRSKGMFLKS
jgi:GNAT superfamily N-acetyltransferase